MSTAGNEVGDALAEGVTSDDCADLEGQGQERLDISRKQAAALQTELDRLGMTRQLAFGAAFGRIQLLTHMGSVYEIDDPKKVLARLAELKSVTTDSSPEEVCDRAVDVACAVIPWRVERVRYVDADHTLRIFRVTNALWEVLPGNSQPRFFYDLATYIGGRAVGRFLDEKAAEAVGMRLIQRLPAEIWEIDEPEEFRIAYRKSGADDWLDIQMARHNHGGTNYGDDLPF